MTILKLVSVTFTIVTLAFACSKQGEGERCNLTNASQDCESGLTCEPPLNPNECSDGDKATIDTPNCEPHRCCYAPPALPTDSRCIGYTVARPSAGTGGGDAGTSGETGGSSSAGGNTAATGGSKSDGGSNATGGNAAATGGVTSSGGNTAATGGAPSTGGTSSASTT